MNQIIQGVVLVVSILLIVLILLQGRGAGLGTSMGGGGELYRTKRGFEQIMFRTTVVLIIAFFVLSISNLLLS